MNNISEEYSDAPDTACGLLDRAARLWPDAPAVRDIDSALTYYELAEASRRVASWLRSRGVGHGDRVLIRHPNVAPMTAFVLGAAYLGAVAVPLSPDMRLFQLRKVIGDVDATMVICSAQETDVLRALCDADVISLAHAWDAARWTPSFQGHGVAQPGDLYLLMHTSGSTASPKGVMCTHRQVTFAVWSISRRLRYQSDDAVFCQSPFSFDYGLYQLLLCLYAGAELQLPERGNEPGLVRRMRDWRSTVAPVVPSLAAVLVSLARRDPRPTRVRLFTNTGAAMEAKAADALRRSFPGAQVCLMFGITECKRISIMEPDGDLVRPGSVGRPIDGTRVEIIDDLGRPVPVGEIGQFVVYGPHVMQGYWQAQELTDRRFQPGPTQETRVLYTGDYGSQDDEGYLYFSGRKDEIFKQRGIRVSTLEIEAAALDIGDVTAAAVLSPADGHGPTLFVVGAVTSGSVLTGLRARLENAKLPCSCRVLAELPLTANGKIDRAALAELAEKVDCDE